MPLASVMSFLGLFGRLAPAGPCEQRIDMAGNRAGLDEDARRTPWLDIVPSRSVPGDAGRGDAAGDPGHEHEAAD